MELKKYSTKFSRLLKIFLAMSEEQQAKLLSIAQEIFEDRERLIKNFLKKPNSVVFAFGVLTGWIFITLSVMFLSLYH